MQLPAVKFGYGPAPDFYGPDDQALFHAAYELANTEFGPHHLEWQTEGYIPQEKLDLLWDGGYMTMNLSPDWGGSGMNMVQSALIGEAFAMPIPEVPVYFGVHATLALNLLMNFGSNEQKDHFIPMFNSEGRQLLCFMLTEPGAGSNPRDMAGSSVEETQGGEPGFRIKAKKTYISQASQADWAVVVVRDGREGNNFNLFLLDMESDGVDVHPHFIKHGMMANPTHEVDLDVWVPSFNRLGNERSGWEGVKNLVGGRIGICAQSIGIAEACLTLSRDYSKERVLDSRTGDTIWDKPRTQTFFEDAEATIHVAKAANIHAARCYDDDPTSLATQKATALGKGWIPPQMTQIALGCRELMGGLGYMDETGLSVYQRSGELCLTYEGATATLLNFFLREVEKAR